MEYILHVLPLVGHFPSCETQTTAETWCDFNMFGRVEEDLHGNISDCLLKLLQPVKPTNRLWRWVFEDFQHPVGPRAKQLKTKAFFTSFLSSFLLESSQ